MSWNLNRTSHTPTGSWFVMTGSGIHWIAAIYSLDPVSYLKSELKNIKIILIFESSNTELKIKGKNGWKKTGDSVCVTKKRLLSSPN